MEGGHQQQRDFEHIAGDLIRCSIAVGTTRFSQFDARSYSMFDRSAGVLRALLACEDCRAVTAASCANALGSSPGGSP